LAAFFAGDVAVEVVVRECQARLPAHVVPGHIEALAELPLGPTGKIDRRALADLAGSGSGDATAGEGGGEQHVFLRAVAQVLGSSPPGGRSFVDAGGDSLDAMRLISRLPPDVGRRLTVRGILQAGSLDEIVASLDAATDGGAGLPAIEPGAVEPWPLSQSQLGLLLAHGLDPDRPTYNVSVLLRLDGPLERQALAEAVRRLTSRQQTLSRRVALDQLAAVKGLGAAAAVELRQVAAADRASAEAMMRAEAQSPFDLEEEQPARFLLATVAAESHLLLISAHHLAVDGWSVSVLLENLAQHYADVLEGTDLVPLPQLSFGDYAVWDSRLLGAEGTAADTEAWQRRLDPYPRRLRIAPDEPPDDRRVPPGTREGVELGLPPEVVRAVQALAAAAKVSPFMVLLAAFSRVVGSRSGLDRFLVGCPMSTRFDWRLEKVVGNLINLLPIPIELGDEAEFTADLRRVSESAHESYRLRHVPLGEIVKGMALPATERWRPLIQVVFQIEDPLRLPTFADLTVDLEEIRPTSIGHDLEFRLAPSPAGLAGGIDFDASIYSRREITTIAADFKSAVENACTSGHR
jgi:hypothetical protein